PVKTLFAPARGHHHGWERPLGEKKTSTPYRRAPGRGSFHQGDCSTLWRTGFGGLDPLCLFHRELEEAPPGSGAPDAALETVSAQRGGGAFTEQCPPSNHREYPGPARRH